MAKGIINNNKKNTLCKTKCKALEIADRKRRFFAHPVILRGLMPRSDVLSRSEGTL